ncbi:hypothetical protein Q028_04183, partial [Pseudomonas aeruginosa BWHPSA015]
MRGATSPAAVITTWPGLFQSTHPCGARHAVTVAGDNRVRVSIHAPVRGATMCVRSSSAPCASFNPHARAGRDWRSSARWWGLPRFNPRARAGRDPSWRRVRRGISGFNPRARAGRDVLQRQGLAIVAVSIHAPVRGATVSRRWLHASAHDVSIHAPVRGATQYGGREGFDLGVSIHAPVRGATALAGAYNYVRKEFQSTRPCGARQPRVSRDISPVEFQSTRPCGARQPRVSRDISPVEFQSTRPCGARQPRV